MKLANDVIKRARGLAMAAIGLFGLMAATLSTGAYGQGGDVAQMQVQISELQEQVRQYAGQVEGLQFQVTQLQELIERMQEDYEFRLGQLEGNAPVGAADDSTQADGAGAQTGDAAPSPSQDAPALVGDEDLMEGGGQPGGDDNLYASDVFANEQEPGRGAPPANLGETQPSAPLDFSIDAQGNAAADGDANAQFQAGYDAVVSGDYAFAEDQFRQFIDQYPESNRAPDASYWLGESLLRRSDYDQAADVLITGFETYPNSTRAPDLLYKLGVALQGTGEFETACRTYAEVLRRYPDSSAAFREDVTNQRAQAGC